MSPKIPMLDLGPEVQELWDELLPALHDVLRSTRFILGPNVTAFERESAEWLGVRRAVALNSGTDALILGLRALGVGPGDEVITTSFTFVATAEAICQIGAKPVFVDIERDTFNLATAQVEARIGPNTRAVVPVHLFGHPADMDELIAVCAPRGIPILEDAAQAFGATWRGRRVGSIGNAAAFSFFPSKNLGAYGDGGLFTTDDDAVADSAIALRNHGARDKYLAQDLGYNSRLDELQAAILRIKLPRVDAWNEARRAVAQRYTDGIAHMAGITPPSEREGARHVFHQYTLRVTDGGRDELERRLSEHDIACAAYYRAPLHTLPPFRSTAELPETERAADEVLSLPIGPYQSAAISEQVLQALRAS